MGFGRERARMVSFADLPASSRLVIRNHRYNLKISKKQRFIGLKSNEYCIELETKFPTRKDVDCVFKPEHQKHCDKDANGQFIFHDIRELLFDEEMKLIRHVFKVILKIESSESFSVKPLTLSRQIYSHPQPSKLAKVY